MKVETRRGYKYKIYPIKEGAITLWEFVIMKQKNKDENLWEVQALDAMPTAHEAEVEANRIIDALWSYEARMGGVYE